MMDSCDRAYQFTTASSHSLNRKYLQRMIFNNVNITERNPLKIYFVIPKSQLTDFEYKYSENIVHPFELCNHQVLENLLSKSLKDEGKKEQEILTILNQLKQNLDLKKNEANIRKFLYEKLRINMKQYLEQEWINLQKKFQCFKFNFVSRC